MTTPAKESSREFIKTLTAFQLKSVFSVDEQSAIEGAIQYLLKNVVFLFPMHEAALAVSLEQRDSFVNALLNVLERIGAFHFVVQKLFDAPSVLLSENDVLSGLVRLYMFQTGMEYCKSVLGGLLTDLAREEIALSPLPDLEAEKQRVTRLDTAVKSLLHAVVSQAGSLPRGLRDLAALAGKSGGPAAARRLLLERFVIPAVAAATEFGLVEVSF